MMRYVSKRIASEEVLFRHMKGHKEEWWGFVLFHPFSGEATGAVIHKDENGIEFIGAPWAFGFIKKQVISLFYAGRADEYWNLQERCNEYFLSRQ